MTGEVAMLRHTTFAIVSLFACGVASAQQPLSPYWNYGGQTGNPAYHRPIGTYGTQPGTCVGGNCPTGNCRTGNCATGNCATGNYANGGMICGPNGCYAPGTAPGSVNPYLPRLPVQNGYPQPSGYSLPYGTQMNPNYRTLPAYSVPSSSYPGFPNVPSARRERHLPTAAGYPLFGGPMPVTGNWNYYSPVTGAADPYDAYSGPGVLH
jgi:hypothetical protein